MIFNFLWTFILYFKYKQSKTKMDEIRSAFQRKFPQANPKILDGLDNPLNGNIFFLETGQILTRGKRGEKGILVRLDSDRFTTDWLDEIEGIEEDKIYMKEQGKLTNEIDEAASRAYAEIDSTGWNIVPVYEVSTTFNSSKDAVTLLPGSIAEISYEFYPMDQAETFSLENLGFVLGDPIPVSETYYGDDCHEVCLQTTKFIPSVKYQIGDDYELILGRYQNTNDKRADGIIYVLMKGDQLLSGFKDHDFSFQEGDGETNVYFYEDQIVIDNMGDVSSIVIINLKPVPL
jgi:hypothetical protein